MHAQQHACTTARMHNTMHAHQHACTPACMHNSIYSKTRKSSAGAIKLHRASARAAGDQIARIGAVEGSEGLRAPRARGPYAEERRVPAAVVNWDVDNRKGWAQEKSVEPRGRCTQMVERWSGPDNNLNVAKQVQKTKEQMSVRTNDGATRVSTLASTDESMQPTKQSITSSQIQSISQLLNHSINHTQSIQSAQTWNE